MRRGVHCRIGSFATLALVLSLVSGCAGTETGNPPRIELALGTYSSAPARISTTPGAAPTQVQHLWLYVNHLVYQECDSTTQVELLDAPEPIDFVAGLRSDLTDKLAAHAYCRLVLEITPAAGPQPGAPEGLQKASVVVSGTRDDGKPFVIRGLFAASFDPRTSSAALNSEHPLLAGFDVATLLGGVDPNAAMPDADGVVRLTFTDAVDQSAILGDALNTSFSLHFDANGNGVVDAAEPDATVR